MGSHAQNIAKKDDVNILVEDVCHFFVFSRISAVNLFFCLRCAFFWVFLVRPPYFLNGFSMLGICILFFLSRPLYLFLYRHISFFVVGINIYGDKSALTADTQILEANQKK
eukprot:GEMP01099214.1.p1 GENE.GEMP01099214.1~~GEMP01099214.1.p1  ORF type:complete len:111 (-),score=4.07 GEMP01099214.1:164-496(-)